MQRKSANSTSVIFALSRAHRRASAKLAGAGAHYVIDSVADLLPVLDDIDRRLRSGGKP